MSAFRSSPSAKVSIFSTRLSTTSPFRDNYMMERRAKIVCTLGPSSSTPELIDSLVGAGMDVARLNFSHGSPEEHAARAAAVRRASGILEKPAAILADLQGPKIRTGALQGGEKVTLEPGQEFVITTKTRKGTTDGVS